MAHTPSPASPVVSGPERGRRDKSWKNADQPAPAPGPPTNLLTRSNKSRSPSLPSLITRSNSSGSNPNAPYSPTRPPCSSYRHCPVCAQSRSFATATNPGPTGPVAAEPAAVVVEVIEIDTLVTTRVTNRMTHCLRQCRGGKHRGDHHNAADVVGGDRIPRRGNLGAVRPGNPVANALVC